MHPHPTHNTAVTALISAPPIPPPATASKPRGVRHPPNVPQQLTESWGRPPGGRRWCRHQSVLDSTLY